MTGDLTRVGDKWQLRFTRTLAHPVERVWRTVVDPSERQAWFPDTSIGDFDQLGAKLRFENAAGVFEPFHGEVLAVDPPRMVEFSWGTDLIRIEIEPSADGCTLTLLDTIDEVGKAARDGAGWHVCLDALEGALDGAAGSGDWRELKTQYQDKFGPEASTIGPPPGM